MHIATKKKETKKFNGLIFNGCCEVRACKRSFVLVGVLIMYYYVCMCSINPEFHLRFTHNLCQSIAAIFHNIKIAD